MNIEEKGVYAACLADLARSGLSETDAKRMRISPINSRDIKKLTRFEASGYRLPYFELNGKTNGFSRVRFLDTVLDKGTGKEQKYWQPPRTGVHVYFPPNFADTWTWGEVQRDPQIDLIITEGEKKAATAVKILGTPCLALGGVWSWGSKQQQQVLLQDLLPFMKGRRLLICFDNDAKPNPDVEAALQALARVARTKGATPFAIRLPAIEPGRKTGLDDYLVAKGKEAFEKLTPVSFDDLTALEDINKELSYIEDKGAFYHIPTRSLYNKTQTLASVVYADRQIMKYDLDGKQRQVGLLVEWSKWPGRRRNRSLVYEPGKPSVLTNGALNTWKGWGVTPKKGNVTMFLELMDQVFYGDIDGKYRKWFEQWLAYPLQHPGVKMYTGVLMYSTLQGVGKSLLAMTMKLIYGDNFKGIKAQDLHTSFNEWAKHRQFILGDEVTGRDKREDVALLNNLITQEYVTINAKFQVEYELRDCTNIYLTTNNPDALSLDPKDRRWFIWEISDQIHPEAWYTSNYDPWYKDPVNAAAIFDYLLHVDLRGFDPRGTAPMTAAKMAMISTSGNALDFVMREFLSEVDNRLLGSKRDLWSSTEIAQLLSVNFNNEYVTVKAVALSLKRAGIPQVQSIRYGKNVVRHCLFAIRNSAKWAMATHAQLAEHMNATTVDVHG